MGSEKCNKCGSVMVVRKNSKKAFFPACPTPEKHVEGYVPPAEIPPTETKKRAIDLW
jgi:ssDNA-binding Zn-finger/Zn-ribbon topoisomerase 1